MSVSTRERFVATVLGLPCDRPPYWLYWGPWGSTWRRWRGEGLCETTWDVRTLFGAEQTPLAVPVNLGPCPAIPRTVLAEDEDYVTFTDTWGITRRDYKHGESMSQFLAFPVRDRRDWEDFRDRYLNPDDPARLAGDWRAACARWMDAGYPIRLGSYPDAGVFGPFRWLMGDEEGLIAFHTMPDLVHEIMDHLTSLYLTVFEKVVAEVRVDEIHLWEDMCYCNGPLISPRLWEQFMGGNYRRIKAFADRHSIPIISVDTDGNPDLIAGPMVRAGVNLLFPMEVAAGCDVNTWQAKYPSLALLGGVDKRVLAEGRAAIDRELARVAPAVAGGRYIPELDHLVPDDVSWENYRYYAETLRRLIGG